MSKEEITLELTKLAYERTQPDKGSSKKPEEEVVTNLYNYIFTHITGTEQNK